MAEQTVGLTLTADDQVSPKVRTIKQELKEAEALVVSMGEKFGATSKQAQEAAKKAAELKDKIGDAKELVDAFNPDTKFKAFGASINTVVGGFTALTGAMALLGVESEEVQKTLLKVQSALAISQGVSQLQQGIQSFSNLGAVLKNALTPIQAIGIAIAAVGAIIIATLNRQSAAQKALNETTKDYARAAGAAREKVTEVRIAFELAEEGVISKEQALKTYNETLGDSLGKTNDLSVAEKNLTDKAEAYIKVTALKAQANALFAKSAQATAEALVAQENLIKEIGTGSIIDTYSDVVQSKIDKAKSDAKEIENIGANLLRQASALAQSSGVAFGGGSTISKLDKLKKDAEEEGRIVAKIEDEKLKQKTYFAERDFAIDTELAAKKMGLDRSVADSAVESARTQAEAAGQLAAYEKFVADSRIAAFQSVANALGAVSNLIGKETAAGKVLGIAQATINTFIGATEVLRAKTVIPEPFGTISKIANVTAVIATGLAAVKNIIKTPVPGAASGGGIPSNLSVSAPLAPAGPGNTTTTLDRDSLNAIGAATTRAFVLEADIANNQERTKRLNRAARL